MLIFKQGIVLKKYFCWLISAALLSAAVTVYSANQLYTPSVFSDHMILQCGTNVPVWGTAEPDTQVTVTFAGQQKKCAADACGRWIVLLDPLQVSSEPQNLVVTASESKLQFTDVLVGEVWLCSGQSNMYRPIGGIPDLADSRIEGADAVLSLPENPRIRLFCDDGHPLWKAMKWQRARSETLNLFSGVGYFFGKKISDDLDVPVGLILVSRVGTMIQAWTPEKYARQAPVTAKYMDLYAQSKPVVQAYNQEFKEYRENRKSGGVRLKQPEPLSSEIDTARTFSNIGGLYDQFMAPQVPFAIRGAIWYQGESNASREGTARHYDEMLRALIGGWRAVWKQPEMPVYFVQLPGWAKQSEYWPWIRQSMLNASLSIPNAGMAVTVDVGDPENLHPAKKQPVGERLARLALAKTYGKSCVYSGPLPDGVRREENGLRIHFNTLGSALAMHRGTWNDVEVAGEDGVFYSAVTTFGPADAFVTSSRVVNPVAVRYGWKGSFEPTLFNTEGLPASPFCFIRDSAGVWRLCSGDDKL